jgi:hypothetical protein
MANLVQLILPSVKLDLKEIAHTFSKVMSIIYVLSLGSYDHVGFADQDAT